jgi:phenylacetic acid degradation operon negative regulatory protein
VLDEAGVLGDAQVFVGSHAGLGDLRALVRQAWDLAEIEQRYEEFLARFRGRLSRDPLAVTAELVHAWRRFPWIDPVLPPALLPTPWSGVAAAKLFARLHDRFGGRARAAWRALDDVDR